MTTGRLASAPSHAALTCIWLIERGGKWMYCGLPAVARPADRFNLDDSPLCAHHLKNEWPAVFGKGKA